MQECGEITPSGLEGGKSMGKQIRFFMGPEDEKRFLGLVLAQQDLIIKPRIRNCEVDPWRENPEQPDHIIYIVSRDSRIVTRGLGFIDDLQSDVLEFSRCVMRDDRHMDYGRIWFEMRYWDEHTNLVQKDKWLSDRFEFYRRWIRKEYRHSNGLDFFVGDQAYEMYREGRVQMMAGPLLAVEFD